MMSEPIELDSCSKKILFSEDDNLDITIKLNKLVKKEHVKKKLIKDYNFTSSESDVAVMFVIEAENWKSIAADLNINYKHMMNRIKKSIYKKLEVDTDSGVCSKIVEIYDAG